MLKSFLEKISDELKLGPTVKEDKTFSVAFSKETVVKFSDLYPGVEMKSVIGACPKGKREDLFIYLMRANLLGQGTGGCRIGLDESENHLTLSLGLPYEMKYDAFKIAIENFINHLVYWRDCIAKFERNENVS